MGTGAEGTDPGSTAALRSEKGQMSGLGGPRSSSSGLGERGKGVKAVQQVS